MQEVEIRVSEILKHLGDTGQFRAALNAIVKQRVGDEEVQVKIIADLTTTGDLSDADLAGVTGGAGVRPGPKPVLIPTDPDTGRTGPSGRRVKDR